MSSSLIGGHKSSSSDENYARQETIQIQPHAKREKGGGVATFRSFGIRISPVINGFNFSHESNVILLSSSRELYMDKF